jgi:hypothetical protein
MNPRFPMMALAALALVSCEDDPQRPTGPIPTLPEAIAREDVLTLLQSACNDRHVTLYSKVLDADFTFYFAPGDVGGRVPPDWGRAEEMDAVGRMFKDSGSPGYPRVTSLSMDIDFETTIQWVEVIPASGAQESWFSATCFYDMVMAVSTGDDYITVPGTKAQFTVRNAGTEAEPKWRLVEMRDLGAPTPAPLAAAASTEKVTWGGAKALFR